MNRVIRLISTLGMFVNIVFLFTNTQFVNGLTYQSNTQAEFTFLPTLTVTTSGDLAISNLTPGAFADSNTIQVTVTTNNAYGYTLSATVGNTNNPSRELRHSSYTSSSDLMFSNLDIGEDLSRTVFASNPVYNNYWGFSTDGTTYSGLPLYNDVENIVALLSSDYMPTDGTVSTDFLIGAKASEGKLSGEYTNVINFVAVAGVNPRFLYDEIETMSKGKQSLSDLRQTIQTPTTDSWMTDTSNSGVYEYDATVFGESSDLGNRPIYYYRGILENNPGDYGSEGSAKTYPNYVKLSNDTCWRIVRTTGSGGIKMIYNGKWDKTTCSNRSSQMTSLPFAQEGSSTYGYYFRNIHYSGYTYNDNMTDRAEKLSVNSVFGNNANLLLNNTRSALKTYIEDTWYQEEMEEYTPLLESSAGYCNDRTIYSNQRLSPTMMTSIQPYQESGDSAYFGARERLAVSGVAPTLGCPRGNVDLYRYVELTSGDVEHEYTGNELKYPVALLTADEAVMAGNGYSGITAYNQKSFLCSANHSWLLSPNFRNLSGYAFAFELSPAGYVEGQILYYSQSVRPVISLKPYAIITGGNGTATQPWMIE